MPSHRDPGERDGDRIVYFDYAKSLENRRRPVPWRVIARSAVLFGAVSFYVAARGFFEPVSATRGAIFAIPAMFAALGLIPFIRSNRALSGDNFAEAKRRPK